MELSDDELWGRTHENVQSERNSSVRVILDLLEIERRELHLDRGFHSLQQVCMEEFKYARSAASDRASCVKLITELPELEAMLIDGSISMTVAKMFRTFVEAEAKLGHIFSLEQKLTFLKKLQNMSCRAVERLFAELRPDLIAKESTRCISGDRVEVKVILSTEDYEGLERLKEIYSHTHPSMSNSELIVKLKEDALNRVDPFRKMKAKAERKEKARDQKLEILGSSETDELRAPGETQESGRTHFTADQTMIILENYDWKGCEYVDKVSARRCGSQHCLQKDHIVPVHLGGTNDPSNIQFLCGKHNRHRAKKEHGQDMTPRRNRGAKKEEFTRPSPTSPSSVVDPHHAPSHLQHGTQEAEAESLPATD